MAERPTLHFVTGNENKVKEVVAIFAANTEAKIPVQACKIDLPELQGEPEDIARNKCAIAVASINGPVMVEDTCLCFNAYHGLPGPYVKWFLEKMGHAGLNTMLDGFQDKTGYAQCTIAYTSGPGADIHVFVGRTEGKIVQARGPTTFGWDPIFEPEGFTETYAEMSKDTKNAISHRRRALEKLQSHLLANQ